MYLNFYSISFSYYYYYFYYYSFIFTIIKPIIFDAIKNK